MDTILDYRTYLYKKDMYYKAFLLATFLGSSLIPQSIIALNIDQSPIPDALDIFILNIIGNKIGLNNPKNHKKIPM
jgi:hypothetical protein